ncbi:hypothetical protein [Flavivirga algicola]|uniref:Cadherin-like beta sandwich domain-containing protein n=1 Tax=Flavivirga algicola TaxID=2729136 RepID=A0ABX1S2I3_9FLAO|nr:hypothetical protein [Flavivirga algicola]NMH88639.1 hypothetical protein [Flavivirga algicola]
MKNLFKTSIFLLISLFIGCSSDDSKPSDDNGSEVDLTAARLDDFQLSGVSYTNISLTQPEIVGGEEKTPGTIIITVPAATDHLNLSLASVNFNESKFEISPAVGSVQSFEVGSAIAYTITSKDNSEKSISYLVSVVKEEPAAETLKITGFKFEKSKNSELPSDIMATKIVEYPGTNWNAIFILVPNETNLTNLIPTIEYKGTSLEYKQGNTGLAAFAPYPETDLTVDFTSNHDLRSTDRNEFLLSVIGSESTKNYRVIVDVQNPIELQSNSASIGDLTEGGGTQIYSLRWTNKGNHPIERNLKASGYIDNTSNKIGNIFEAYLEVSDPLQGAYIKPGEEGLVILKVNTDGAAIGDYDINVTFSPRYDVNRAKINDIRDDLNPIEDIFSPIILNTRSTIKSE